MIDVIKDQISIFDLDIWSGKMSKEHYQAQGKKTVKTTEVKTSGQYLQKSSESQNQTRPMCLCLKKESGQKPGAYTMSWGGGPLLGEYMTRSFGEQPSMLMAECSLPAHRSGVSVSLLSQILQGCLPRKYYLSAAACAGILRRSKKRNKKLPEALEKALIKQSASRNEQESQGGKGILIQEEKTGAISTVNNQSVFQSKTICLQGNAIDRADTAGCNGKGWNDEGVSYTLNTIDRPAVFAAGFDANQGSAAHGIGYEEEKTATIIAGRPKNVLVLNDQGGEYMNVSENITGTIREESKGHEPICVEMTSTKNTIIENGVCPTLTARMGTGGNQVNAVCMDVGFFQTEEEKAGALLARQYKDPPITYQQTTGALLASGYSKNRTQEAANNMYVVRGDGVFRLTPLECERLQGFPDGWTDIGEWTDTKGKTHKPSDGPRYRALGNSIALPFWFWLLRRISAQYERQATMASLFDGIGGFPLCWERCNGKGTAIWASEIEEFPIAVTKKRFPEE